MARLTESAEVREEIVQALGLDLIGPWAGHPLADERLPGWVRPSNWYLTGFLVPRGAPAEQRGDADVDEESEVAESAGLGDDSAEDRRAAKKGFFPSSMGLSFLVGADVDTLEVIVRWGDYRRVEAEGGSSGGDGGAEAGEAEAGGGQRSESTGQGSGEGGGDGGADGRMPAEQAEGGASSVRSWWQRTPREEPVPVTLPAVTGTQRPQPVPSSGGLTLHAVARPVDAAHFAGRIPPGTRSVSLFLVNGRRPSSDQERDETFAFQAEIEVRSPVPFVPRPDPREVSGQRPGTSASRTCTTLNTPEYAAGHGVSADWKPWWTGLAGSCGPPGPPPPTWRRRRPSTCRGRSSTCGR